jgi:hypothetical protein
MPHLSRSAFAAVLLFCLGALGALALGTLHFETASGAVGYSTPVAVGLMVLLVLRALVACYQRAGDMGASALGSCLAVVASLAFQPFAALALLFLPSVRQDGEPPVVAKPLKVACALPLGVGVGLLLLFLTQAVCRAL